MVKFIAEFCQNHKGDMAVLQEMIHQAAENGATYGKIQTIFADDLAFRPEFEEGKTIDGAVVTIKRPYKSEYERLKNLELSYEEQAWFVRECGKYGLKPLTTCFARGSIKEIMKLGMDTIKVASYDCGSFPLIRDLAVHFRHLIISTGATYDDECERTAAYLKGVGADFSFLHCVTIYPTPLSAIHLNRMKYLQMLASEVGFSDHTLVSRDGIKASLAAIYCGANLIERHFTILKQGETKDGPVSIDPVRLRELVEFSNLSKEDQKKYLSENIPEFQMMLGMEKRELTDEEKLNRAYYRGRFATHRGDRIIYNWEDVEL